MLFIALSSVLVVIAAAKAPVICTTLGDIGGVTTMDSENNLIYAYLGIPFAEPPVGDLRFRKPIPHRGFTKRFDASTLGNACNQIDTRYDPVVYKGDEDCLTLNVYVPSGNVTSSGRPVIVWIHGGAFIHGAASVYDPTPLVTVGKVIAVTIQYRLGSFGFLSTMDGAARGNYGLWDQLLALRWIKKHISAFGGDPEMITVMGESAGSASIGFLTLSPLANGLFRRVVLQSGTVTAPWAIKKDSLSLVKIIATAAGCSQQDHIALVSCLRALPARNLSFSSLSVPPLGPVVDGAFIAANPHELISSSQYMNAASFPSCDIMIGVNNNEGARAFKDDSAVNAYRKANNVRTRLAPKALSDLFGENNQDMIDAALFEYIFPTPLDSDLYDLQSVTNMMSDVSHIIPAVQFARAHSSINGTGNTFLYYFNHFPKMSVRKEETWLPGMHHAYDLYYTFGFNDAIVKGMNSPGNFTSELPLSLTFRRMLTEFVKSGNPYLALKENLHFKWTVFDEERESYLDFNNHIAVKNHVVRRRVSLWTDLLFRLRHTEGVKAVN